MIIGFGGGFLSVKLLDKTRKISRLLHENKSDVVIFSDICNLLGKLLGIPRKLAVQIRRNAFQFHFLPLIRKRSTVRV